jgi:hypothetical protein
MISASHLMVEFELLVIWEIVNLLSFPNSLFDTSPQLEFSISLIS